MDHFWNGLSQDRRHYKPRVASMKCHHQKHVINYGDLHYRQNMIAVRRNVPEINCDLNYDKWLFDCSYITEVIHLIRKEGPHRWLSARKAYLQCISNGVTSFLHEPIDIENVLFVREKYLPWYSGHCNHGTFYFNNDLDYHYISNYQSQRLYWGLGSFSIHDLTRPQRMREYVTCVTSHLISWEITWS